MKFIATLFFLVVSLCSLHGQEEIDIKLKKIIQRKVVKCLYLKTLKVRGGENLESMLKRPDYWDFESLSIRHSIPSFGFAIPDIIIHKYPQSYPDRNYTLYEVDIPRNKKNDSLDVVYNMSYVTGTHIIGINKENKIKFIGGSFFKHHIVQDFTFNKKKPESYIQFLELSMFDMEHEGITYSGKKGSLYVYKGKSHIPNIDGFTIELDPKEPSDYHTIYDYNSYKYGTLDPKPLLPLRTKVVEEYTSPNIAKVTYLYPEDVINFVKGEVMKNLYLYRLQKKPDTWDFLDKEGYFKTDDSPIDGLIPDYDEKMVLDIGELRAYGNNKLLLYVDKSGASLTRPEGYLLYPLSKDSTEDDTFPYRGDLFYDKYYPRSQKYLVGFDFATQVIYYISGEFYLSKILYFMDIYKDLKPFGTKSSTEEYIRFRLYQYHKGDVISFSSVRLKMVSETSDNIIYEATYKDRYDKDAEKKLRVTLNYKTPEILIIEKE